MRLSFFNLPIFCFSLAFPILALSEGNLENGKELFQTCATCHGHNGEGVQANNAPKLSGLRQSYLLGQLQKFRSGLRGANPEDRFGIQMASMARTLTDEQALLDVVAYIGTLEAPNPTLTELNGDPLKGKEGYAYCERCHGPTGLGYESPEKITYRTLHGPRLAGQHDWYLIRQVQNFKARIRGVREDKAGWYMQADVQSLLTDQEIKDVVAYISTLE